MQKIIHMADLNENASYALMTQVIIPRPIAWVLTQNVNGSLNLAPFSYFAAVSSVPPLVMISVGHKASSDEGEVLKDTAVNILRERRCVIHIAPFEKMDQVQQTAAELDEGESEVIRFGIEITHHESLPLPQVKGVPIALQAVYFDHHVLGFENQHVFYLQIESVTLLEGLGSDFEGRLTIDPQAVNPLARLGSGYFSGINRISKPP